MLCYYEGGKPTEALHVCACLPAGSLGNTNDHYMLLPFCFEFVA
jgi:hypothetical protein